MNTRTALLVTVFCLSTAAAPANVHDAEIVRMVVQADHVEFR